VAYLKYPRQTAFEDKQQERDASFVQLFVTYNARIQRRAKPGSSYAKVDTHGLAALCFKHALKV